MQIVDNMPQRCRQRHRPAAQTIHIDMHKMPLGGGRIGTFSEQADFIPNARDADMGHPQAHIDCLRVCQSCKVIAMGFDNESDRRAVMNVQRPLLDQQCMSM